MKKHPAIMAEAYMEAKRKGMKGTKKNEYMAEAASRAQKYWTKQVTDSVEGFDMGDAPAIVAAIKLNLKALKKVLPKEMYETGLAMAKKINLTVEARKMEREDTVIINESEEVAHEGNHI